MIPIISRLHRNAPFGALKGFPRARSTTLSLMVLVALPLFVGCAGKQVRSETGFQARDYYPLAVGNAWTYKITPAPPDNSSGRVEIVSADDEGFFVDNRGNRLMGRTDGVFDGHRFLLQEPLEMGHKWKAIPSPSVVEDYEIIGIGVRVSVPAGTYENCVKVKGQIEIPDSTVSASRTLQTVWTYAPGVGLVHMVQNVKQGSAPIQRTAEFQLVEFVQGSG
jgi:hypothetical protein